MGIQLLQFLVINRLPKKNIPKGTVKKKNKKKYYKNLNMTTFYTS